MPQHIKPYDNGNKPIIDVNDSMVPLCYLNKVKLNQGEQHCYQLDGYESCCVFASGTADVKVDGAEFIGLGGRSDVWSGKPDSVYAPLGARVEITASSDNLEVFIAGGRCQNRLEPFAVRAADTGHIQYGSDDTKTHRRITHILGKNVDGKVDRLLVSELHTVGAGGWSGFPSHKHDTDRLPNETRFEEAYLFRFSPDHGFGAQFSEIDGEEFGQAHHIKNDSVFVIDKGYHPCVAAPGYEMYYFTIIVGESTRSLVQHFHPDHAYQVETIPGIKNMIAGFK